MSLGLSIALIATGIWFLFNRHGIIGYGNDRWGMSWHMIGWGGGSMGIVMILFWVVVFTAIGMVLSAAIDNRRYINGTSRDDQSDALEILKQRYARGEIDKNQFDEMKQDLS